MVDRRDTWTIERKITISGIVSIAMLAGAILTSYIKTTERVNALEIALTYQKGVNDQIKQDQLMLKTDTGVALAEVKTSLREMGNDIKRLLERGR